MVTRWSLRIRRISIGCISIGSWPARRVSVLTIARLLKNWGRAVVLVRVRLSLSIWLSIGGRILGGVCRRRFPSLRTAARTG